MLDGWDDEAHKYKEAQTGGLHTKERCQEAKLKLEAKNDHGNEMVQGFPIPEIKNNAVNNTLQTGTAQQGYVDHTLKPRLKAKTFTDPTPEGLDLKINTFGDTHKVTAGQYQMAGALYSTQVWYEEVAK